MPILPKLWGGDADNGEDGVRATRAAHGVSGGASVRLLRARLVNENAAPAAPNGKESAMLGTMALGLALIVAQGGPQAPVPIPMPRTPLGPTPQPAPGRHRRHLAILKW